MHDRTLLTIYNNTRVKVVMYMTNQALIKPIESLKRSGIDKCVKLMNRF